MRNGKESESQGNYIVSPGEFLRVAPFTTGFLLKLSAKLGLYW